MTSSIEEILDALEEIRNWFNEAPIDELEAVEAAIERNAPINAIDRAISGIWKLHGDES